MSKRKPKLTYEQKQMMLGSLLGDAGLSYRIRNGNSSFEFYVAHGPKQREYIKYQAEMLNVNLGTYKKSSKSFGPNGIYHRYSYSNKKELKKLHSLCFKDNRKVVNEKWLSQIDAQGIAYWFMDDGSSSYDVSNNKTVMVRFATQSFSKEENEMLIEKLQTFGVETTLRQIKDGTGYNIYVRQRSVNNLMDLVEPYIVTSDMKYKIKRRKI